MKNFHAVSAAFLGACLTVSWVGFRMLRGMAEEGANAIDEVFWGDDD